MAFTKDWQYLFCVWRTKLFSVEEWKYLGAVLLSLGHTHGAHTWRTHVTHTKPSCGVDSEQMHRDESKKASQGSWKFSTFVFDAIYEAWLQSLASKLDTPLSLQQIHSFIQMASASCSQRIQINTIGKQGTNHSDFFIS